jgi:carboxylesterase type B
MEVSLVKNISISSFCTETMLPPNMKLVVLLSNLLLFFFNPVSARHTNDLLVTTTSGTFEGFYPHKSVRAFLGMPYAVSPVGPLRFSPPQPLVSKNKTVHDASSFGKTCFQFRYKTIGFEKRGPTTGESEDCLTINVWGPAHRKSKKFLPALIWIYGGGWGEGTSSDFCEQKPPCRELH